jgi:hypothetical protein
MKASVERVEAYINIQSLIVRTQTIDYSNDGAEMQGTELWEIAK